MIYEADCHALKTNQKTNVKIDDYFLWKERSLFSFNIAFSGQNIQPTRYGIEETDKVNTTISYQFKSADVINDQRENKFAIIKPDNTYDFVTSDSFNPAGPYGKINDSDLIRIKHNPCFNCKFTAYVNLLKQTTNAVVPVGGDDPPPVGDQSYEQYDVVGRDIVFVDPFDGDESYGYLVNSAQRVVVSCFLLIHSGFIDPKTRNLGKVVTLGGWAAELEANSNATIKVGGVEFKGLAGLEEGITAQIIWDPNKKRPA